MAYILCKSMLSPWAIATQWVSSLTFSVVGKNKKQCCIVCNGRSGKFGWVLSRVKLKSNVNIDSFCYGCELFHKHRWKKISAFKEGVERSSLPGATIPEPHFDVWRPHQRNIPQVDSHRNPLCFFHIAEVFLFQETTVLCVEGRAGSLPLVIADATHRLGYCMTESRNADSNCNYDSKLRTCLFIL